MIEHSIIDALIKEQNPNKSLRTEFYSSNDIWNFEESSIFSENWICFGHESELSGSQKCIVRQFSTNSILITKSKYGVVRAFANVCRHRGSQLLDDDTDLLDGTIVCPYHGWKYSVEQASTKIRGYEKNSQNRSTLSLKEFAAEIVGGLIFVRFGTENNQNLKQFGTNTKAYFELQGIADAVVSHREKYVTQANWKIVIENFRECLHCVSSHPGYCEVYEYPETHEYHGEAACIEETMKWGNTESETPELAGLRSWENYPPGDGQPHFAMRRQIGRGKSSLSKDGAPVSSLMGTFSNFDGGDTVLALHPFSALWCANDYAVLFRFVPRTPTVTDVELTWLVGKDASDNCKVDIERMIWLWDTTTQEDKVLVERTQKGVLSRHYEPGFFTEQERSVAWTTKWYLETLEHHIQMQNS